MARVTGPAAVLMMVGVIAGGCGGKNAVEDARSVPHAGSGDAGSGTGTGAGSASPRGDAQIRVEWREPPTAMRGSPGRTRCNTARRPPIEPTSTWGIPEVAVWVDGAPIVTAPAPVRVVLSPCAIAPRIAVARPGATLAIVSAIEHPLDASVMHYGDPASEQALAGFMIATALPAGAITRLQLPVVGHEVDLALAAPAVDAVSSGDDADAVAWVLTVPTAAAITDASGQVVLRDLPVGAHRVTAWLPRYDKQAMQVAHGKLDVLPGGLAEVTLDLSGAGSSAGSGTGSGGAP